MTTIFSLHTITLLPDSFIIIALILFGFLWGSFLNVVIYRLPLIDIAGLRYRTPYTLMFLAWPLSFCPKCKKNIRPWHNIPVLSYLWLRGKGACCQTPIHIRYLFIELLGGVIVYAAYYYSQSPFEFACLFVLFSILLVASVIDLYRYYLLDILTLPLLWLGLLVNINDQFAVLSDAVLGAALGYVALFSIDYVFSIILKKQAMGMGDMKLMAALGAWLGWQDLPLLLFIGSILAIVLTGIRRLIRGRYKRQVPFGACLALAGVIMLLYGEVIMVHYWLRV